MVAAGRQLLQAVLFTSDHVQGLVDAVSAASSNPGREMIPRQKSKTEQDGVAEEQSKDGKEQHIAPSYLSLLFQVGML
jgi:hypothetical protein